MTSPDLPTKIGTRYDCQLRNKTGLSFRHDHGDGRPTRKKCSYCGGQFNIWTGYYGTFTHLGDGRYKQDEAFSLHRTEKAAEAARTGEQVVRWITHGLNGRDAP